MSLAAVGGVLSGVGSIASGLGLGGGKFKSWHGRENARNEWFNLSGDRESKNYYDAVRRGADSAGINVITALGGAPSVGSAAGTYVGPKMGAMSAVIEGFKGIADEFNGTASQERAARELQLDLAKVELENAKALRGAVGVAPVSAFGGPRMGKTANAAVQTLNGRPVTVKRNNERTGVSVLGVDIDPALGTSDAEDIEARYGDIVSGLAGALTLVSDGSKTFRKWTRGNAQNFRSRNAGAQPFEHSNTNRWRQ